MNEDKMDDQGWIQNKRRTAGCTFYFVLSRPCACYVLIEVKCEVNCDSLTRSEWSLNSSTLRLIFWVYSKTQAASRDIPLLLINTNNPHELFSTWMVDTHELEHHSRLVQHMADERVRYIERFQAHEWLIHESWIPWVTSIIWLSNYLFSVQWVTVTMLTVALIVRTINFYTHFSKNTNLETETSLPII